MLLLPQLTVCPPTPLFLCSFLYEPSSQGYKYYRQKLEEFRKARTGPTGTQMGLDLCLQHRPPPETPSGSVPPTAMCPASSAPSPAVTPAPAAQGKPATIATVKRKRKSRWGPEEDKVELPPAELVQRDTDTTPSPLSGRLCQEVWHHVFRVCLCYSRYQDFIPFSD